MSSPTTTDLNHGQYVSSQGGGKVAAQSCTGMPLNSAHRKVPVATLRSTQGPRKRASVVSVAVSVGGREAVIQEIFARFGLPLRRTGSPGVCWLGRTAELRARCEVATATPWWSVTT